MVINNPTVNPLTVPGWPCCHRSVTLLKSLQEYRRSAHRFEHIRFSTPMNISSSACHRSESTNPTLRTITNTYSEDQIHSMTCFIRLQIRRTMIKIPENITSNGNPLKVSNTKVLASYDPAISASCPASNIASALVNHLFLWRIPSVALCH